MRSAIALFARAPIPGSVKTRLIGRLTPEQACDLHRALALDTWDMLSAFRAEAEVFLYTDRQHPEWRALAGAGLRIQTGADLGTRMLQCFLEMESAGFSPLLIVGSDSPTLTAAVLAPWTKLPVHSPALIGPAEDGGYYAVGCRAPRPGMFEGVEWSSPRTFTQTVAALERAGLPPSFLPAYYDIDTPESLARLPTEAWLPEHTRCWVASNL